MKNLQWGRPSSILEMYAMVSIIAFAILSVVDGVEWDCAASTNTGNFTRNSDCTISGTGDTNDRGGGVDVTGTLEIVGSSTDMNNLVTISAASKERHFYVNGANDKLVLRYVKLVGGDAREEQLLEAGDLAPTLEVEHLPTLRRAAEFGGSCGGAGRVSRARRGACKTETVCERG